VPSGNLGLRSSRLLWEISWVNNRLTVVFSRRWRQAAQLYRSLYMRSRLDPCHDFFKDLVSHDMA